VAAVTTNYFDEPVAARYDDGCADMFEPAVLDPTVDLLGTLAGDGGSALELGIGTGRVALPLADRGVRVHGIELSAAMADRLRAKPGADQVEVTIGDFATTRVGEPGSFDLAYLVFNTITNLTTQDAQVDCFCNVAAHLRPGGCFVVETFVPILQRLPPGEVFRVFHRSAGQLGFDEYDVANQLLRSHHYRFGEDGTYDVTSPPFRYVWPAELDLMARIAGLRLRDRWGDWTRAPFTGASESHVSVWERPA
jgi:SAM-dependent methyltransferase